MKTYIYILREWTHDIKWRERQCNAMDEWDAWMKAMELFLLHWEDSTLNDMNDINCNELNSKPVTWNEMIHNITQLYIHIYVVYIYKLRCIYIYIYYLCILQNIKYHNRNQEIHEITFSCIHGMHWHEWIDDMNKHMMKYLNEMTTVKDMNTCMKYTTWPDTKWHDMQWHEMTWHTWNDM